MYSKREPQTEEESHEEETQDISISTEDDNLFRPLETEAYRKQRGQILPSKTLKKKDKSNLQDSDEQFYELYYCWWLIQKQYKSYDLINAHSLAVWEIIILQNITVQ